MDAIMGTMDLPAQPPVDPGVWSYEPKWDGFLH